MMRSVACGAALVSCAMLQGCGDASTTTPAPSPPSSTPAPAPAPSPAPSPPNSTTAAPNSTTAAPNTTNTTNTTTTLAPSPPPAPTPEELVAEFNALYVAWDPDNDTSSLGLMYSVGSPLDTRCNECDDNNHNADCRVSAALLNHQISVPGKQMLFREGTVGGFLYWPETVAPMVRCSYGMDGATDGRINHGCGCEMASACGGSADCPSACENKDPQTGNEFERNHSMFSRCHCRPGDSLNGHCFWEGPSFYHGEGTDELRNMVKQRHQFMGSAATEWNEVVIDSQAHDQSLKNDAAGLIAAFVVPVNSRCDRACIRDLLAIRDATTEQLNLAEPLPVVGLNVDGGETPFEVFDPFSPSPGPGPSPSPGPAPASGSCCWGGSTCETAQNCHGDAFCGSGEEQCTGACSGVWCAQAFV